ncbi:MAG: hypothetical protein R3F59_24795 [Myxococcota bacterium]
MTEGGSLPLALGVGIALLVGLLLETRLLLRWRRDAYFVAGLPLARALVPIPRPPARRGRTPSVRWE